MEDTIKISEYITPKEAGQILGVTGRRVRQLLADGAIAGKFVFRRWFVDRASLYQYLSERNR